MKKQLLYYLVILLIFNSCSREDDGLPENTILPKTLKTRYPDNSKEDFITDFIYDGNKIVSIVNKFNKRDYEYDGNHIVKETIYGLHNGEKNKSSETLYAYENDNLTTVTKILNGQKTKYVYSYNSNGIINKDTYELDNNNGKESKKTEKELISMFYGNIIVSEFNWGDDYDVVSISKYQYDTNKNVFKNIAGINLLLDQFNLDGEVSLSSNNNIQRFSVNHIQGTSSDIVFEPHSFRMEYEYNKNGYPIKKTTYDYTDQIIEIVEYIY